MPELAAHCPLAWLRPDRIAGAALNSRSNPESIERDLPAAVKTLADEGLRVLNVTAAISLDDERLYSACAEAGVGMNRVMFWQRDPGLLGGGSRRAPTTRCPPCPSASATACKSAFRITPSRFVPVNEMGMYNLVKDYDPRYVAAVWDPAHIRRWRAWTAMPRWTFWRPIFAWSTLKNAFWRRVSGPEAATAEWKIYWTSGRARPRLLAARAQKASG